MKSTVTTLDELLHHNHARTAAFHQHPFFGLLQESTLADARKLDVLMACIQGFSNNFQNILFIRQALCVDPRFKTAFSQHLSEEIGHDTLLAHQRGDASVVRDTLFDAILAWFSYQMLVLDNAERAALMHLVLETGADYFYRVAAPSLGKHVASSYFQFHAEADDGHANLVMDLLEGLGPKTYARLGDIVDAGWDMIDAMLERVRWLVEQAA
ncbi:MAG: hypothetical protein ACOY0T_11730 [Myxococcota bacterium]